MDARVADVEPLPLVPRQHRGKTMLGMPQRREQHSHVRQVELVRRRLRQLVAQRVHLRDCGFVGHGSLVAGR